MKIKIICGVLIIKKDKFVIIQEGAGKVKGKWNFPAGHLNPDEKINAGAIREAKEETGLNIKLKEFIGIYQFKGSSNNNVIGFYFSASTTDKKFNYNKKEIAYAKWISFSDFLKMDQKIIRSKHLKQFIRDYQKRGGQSLKIINSNNLN